MNTSTGFWPQWRHLLLHAEPLYWKAQGLALVLMLFPALFFLMPNDAAGVTGNALGLRLARFAFDSLLMLGGAHVALRPPLKLWFVGQHRPLAHWAGLMAWMLALCAVVVFVSYHVSEQVLRDGMNFRTVQFSSERESFAMDFSASSIHAIGMANMFATYLLWALLYLAYKAFQSRRQLQAQLREARVRQLTHQLNPHFLFNTFNTIRGMIFEDRERAAQLVTQLSELFRFHLSHELRTEQTLAEEWELAKRYLDVEAVRLESRLRLEVDLDPHCLHRKLPSLTLLTLVENAIKHGIAPNPGGGRLDVRARCAGAGWQLEVGNSVGPGTARVSSGTGLANLRERVALTLGPAARLDITHDDAYFTLRLELPA